jgi:hypothetical protein
MATRQQRLDDVDSNGEPPAGELMELLCDRFYCSFTLYDAASWSANAFGLISHIRDLSKFALSKV